jgi:riboflavin kinase/FMN adenylyltransferase
MKVITGKELAGISLPTAIALGNFDGLHLGHQRVIASILGSRACSTVVSFDPHPQEFFQKTIRLQLTPIEEKLKLLESLGVQQLVLLPFDEELSQLTADQFMEDILHQQLQAEQIAVGFNFRFGQKRQGTVYMLKRRWRQNLTIVSEQSLSDAIRISSSNIRNALSNGDLIMTQRMLGRPYSLTGTVVAGQQLGRQMGFPTANLLLPERKFIPKHGVYGVQVDCAHGQNLAGVMNIGIRPTVKQGTIESAKLVAEVHILDFHGDLYGSELRVKLMRFLRPEQKFNSLEELRQQIALDCGSAKQVAGSYGLSLA